MFVRLQATFWWWLPACNTKCHRMCFLSTFYACGWPSTLDAFTVKQQPYLMQEYFVKREKELTPEMLISHNTFLRTQQYVRQLKKMKKQEGFSSKHLLSYTKVIISNILYFHFIISTIYFHFIIR